MSTHKIVTEERRLVARVFRFVSYGGVSAVYWVDKSFSYALMADIDRSTLFKLSNMVYDEPQSRRPAGS